MNAKLRYRLLSTLVALCMVLVLFPAVALAAEGGDVAQIGDATYATLDDAVAAAADGATIELLADATTSGLNLSKNLTIQAAEGLETKPTVTFTQYGIALWGKALTFKDCNVVMNGIGSTPYTAEWSWMAICASSDASLTLDNVTMTMDATGVSNSPHAIYFCNNNVLNLVNGTELTIKNYPQDALEWDGGNGGYNVNITNSTYISDNNRSGFTGTFYATIDNSTVEVLNSSANGSNGTYYTIKNGSDVEFDNNGSWGISAYRIDMSTNSTLIATDNGYSGIWTRILNADETCTIDVENNGYGGQFDLDKVGSDTAATSNAGISFWGHVDASEIQDGANVTIKNNAGSGISGLQGVSNLTIGSATIVNNGTNNAGAGAVCGGGIYTIGTMNLGPNVVIYNNHATTAGDDLYFAPRSDNKTFSFSNVGADWALDGDPDCEHRIDGWYDDSNGTRWEAHAETEEGNHIVLFDEFTEDTGLATVTGLTALKAAHGAEGKDKTSYPGLDKVIVTEDGTEVDADTAAAGGTVNFKLTTNVPDDLLNYINLPDVDDPSVVNVLADEPVRGSYQLVIHDQMDDELVLDPESIVVTLGVNDVLIPVDQYTVAYDVAHDDGTICDFEITLDLVNLYEMGAITEEDIDNATPITVTYTATLAEDVTAGEYLNTAWVTYPEGESEKSTVTVKTYGISIFKYDQANNAPLSGATFELYQKDAEGNVIEDSVIELTSGENGYAVIEGLDAGTYYLKETQAPEGYVCSEEELTITVPGDAGEGNYVVSVSFANAQVPHTGGTGTLMYTIGGAAIILLAGALLLISRYSRKKQVG